jgi:hypothetical protein
MSSKQGEDCKAIHFSSSKQMKQQSQRNALENSIVKALTTVLYPDQAQIIPGRDHYQWQKDSHIFANYLVSLLCAVVESLQ